MRGLRGLLVVAVGILACGGAVHGPSVEGTWLLILTRGGIDDPPRHMTLTQDEAAVTAEFTCQSDLPVGEGTYDGHDLSLTFDFGDGLAGFTGTRHGRSFSGTVTLPEGEEATFTLERTRITLDCTHACDPVTPIQFVDHDFTNLDKIEEISLFRSSAGHSYTDGCESCRSMKHYYAPYAEFKASNGLVEVYSPVDGTVVLIEDDGHGASPPGENKQVRIRSAAHPDYTFVLFHVDLLANPISVGDVVSAGEQVGTGRLIYPDIPEVAHDFDVGVFVHTLYGDRDVSFIETLTDSVFAAYVSRGASARSDFVITEAARDADPLTCTDETFTSTGSLDAWFVLDPP